MRYFRDSFFLKLINKLDVREDSFIFRSLKTSFFLRLLNNFFSFTQGLFANITCQSRLLPKIDYFILFLVTLLLISLTFATTKIIGLLAGICFLAFLLKLFLLKGEKLTINTFDTQIFLYILIIGLSVAFSTLLIPALKGFTKVIVYFGSYLVFFNILKDKPSRSYYLITILAVTAFAESMTAIYQNFAGVAALATWQDKTHLNPEQIMTRVYGTLQPFNPNLLAGYLVAAVSSAAGLFFLCAVKKKFRLSIISLLVFFAILAGIVFTGSRGSYLAVSAMLAMLIMVSGHIIWHDFGEKTWLKKTWLYIIALGSLAVLAIIISSPALQHRIASIFTLRGDSSNSFRLNVYAASIKMFFDHWLIGIGPGNNVFRLIYGLYMKTGYDALGAYSVPLEIAVESGIFAFLVFFWLIAAIFLKGAKTIIYGKNIEQKILVACCMASILGIMVHGLVDTIFFRPQVQLVFWMFVAILGANIGVSQKAED